MILSDGKTPRSRIQSTIDNLIFRLRNQLVRTVKVRHQGETYLFKCESPIEIWRAVTLFQKEPETISWINDVLDQGDSFIDVGANIGCYSLVAAKAVGNEGNVYAFEPHPSNVINLLRNLKLNGCEQTVQVFSCPLDEFVGVFQFNYASTLAGSSMSQLHSCHDGFEQAFLPIYQEQKPSQTIDSLLQTQAIRTPHAIKMDVDGNELLVLKGMKHLLASSARPRSLLIEVNQRYRKELFEFLSVLDYRLVKRDCPGESTYNGVFEPV